MTIVPGYGTDQLHLRQSSSDLRARFGLPTERRTSGKLREYWLYPQKGFECIVSRRTGHILSIFFSERFSRIASVEGTHPFGASEGAVIAMLGAPSDQGGGFKLSTGEFIGKWLSFDSGIGFHFDHSGRVRTLSVFSAKRNPKIRHAKAALRVPMRRIAAMQNS